MNEQALTVKGFENTYKVGHTKACEEIKSGRLESYKLGRRRYISVRAAADWQRRLEAEANPDGGDANVPTAQFNTKVNCPAPNLNPARRPCNSDAHHPVRPRKLQAQKVAA